MRTQDHGSTPRRVGVAYGVVHGGAPPPEPPPTEAHPFDAGPFRRVKAALRLTTAVGSNAIWRGLAVAAVSWLPLALLAAVQGHLLGGKTRESFLLDVSAHARYLIALPLLIACEPWCLAKLARVTRPFSSESIIAADDRDHFARLLRAVRRALDNHAVEVVMALGAFAVTAVVGSTYYPRDVSTWAAPIGPGGSAISLAGWWRILVSHPLFLIATATWLWRVGVWVRFVWGVSRLQLRLVPAHPDRAGGLGFISGSTRAFAPVAAALGCVISGTVALELVVGAKPVATSTYVTPAAVTTGAMLVLFVAPLMLFMGVLRRSRLKGKFDYGNLARSLGRHFEDRWLRPGRPVDAGALSAADFSATTDLYSIVSNARNMSLLPFGLRDLIPVVLSTLLPFLPLALLVVPLGKLLRQMVSLFL
jgi:hypothetical protein